MYYATLVPFLLLIACGSTQTARPPDPTVALGPYGQRAADAAQSKGATDFLRGTFDRIAYTVEGTGEQFTVVHEGGAMRVVGGTLPDLDLALTVTQATIDTLIARLGAEPFTPANGAQLLASFMVPLVRQALKKPIHTNPIVVALAADNERVCFELTDGSDQIVGRLRAEFVEKGWKVTDTFDGPCDRTLRADPAAAVAYQREMHKADRENTALAWREFQAFYRDWRSKHTVPGSVKP